MPGTGRDAFDGAVGAVDGDIEAAAGLPPHLALEGGIIGSGRRCFVGGGRFGRQIGRVGGFGFDSGHRRVKQRGIIHFHFPHFLGFDGNGKLKRVAATGSGREHGVEQDGIADHLGAFVAAFQTGFPAGEVQDLSVAEEIDIGTPGAGNGGIFGDGMTHPGDQAVFADRGMAGVASGFREGSNGEFPCEGAGSAQQESADKPKGQKTMKWQWAAYHGGQEA